jgi:hypothetical protein
MFERYAFVIPLFVIIVVVTFIYVTHSSSLILVFTEPGCGNSHTLLSAASARISLFLSQIPLRWRMDSSVSNINNVLLML